MKLVKSLLLGSAAGVVAVASAQAADLPTKKAAPVEYVRVCDAYGAGFFYIPGTQTCLRVGGRIRAEYTWLSSRTSGNYTYGAVTGIAANASARAKDSAGFRARGRLNVDARTQTSWGTLRTFIRYEITRNSGVYLGGNAGPGGAAVGANLAYGFIQFAGITAGRAQSMFDYYADSWNYEALRDSDAAPVLLAYTATFGGGFSATISIEDKNERQGALGATQTNGVFNLVGGPGIGYAGYRLPDLVANLRVDQGWGSAQLSAAVGQRNTYTGAGIGAAKKDYTAWAIQGGVMINLPMLAAGDQLWLQAAYARGSMDYIGIGPNSGNFSGGFLGRSQGGLQHTHVDAASYFTPGGGYGLEVAKGWSALAAFQHYWAPSFRQVLFGSYAEVTYGARTRASLIGNANEWRVGTQLIWSPVKDFDIGLELMYVKLHQTLVPGTAAALVASGLKKDPDAFQARLRFQRDF